jgi:hypothetical protein
LIIRKSLRRSGVAALAVVVAVASFVVPAQAVTIKSRSVAGVQTTVSCLSITRCVLVGYNTKSQGDVVAVNNGVPGHVSIVSGTQEIYAVSCPDSSGCTGIARPTRGTNAEFVTINKSGDVTGSTKVPQPTGVMLNRIACTALDTCEVAGTNVLVSPVAVEIGTWDGVHLALHRIKAPAHSFGTTVNGLSCFVATCVAVVTLDKGTKVDSVIVDESNNVVYHVHTANNDSLYGVDCVTAELCYATGYNDHSGLIVTLEAGVATKAVTVHSDQFDIACVGTVCTSVGEETATRGARFALWGTIISVHAGKVVRTQVVNQCDGFNSVASLASGTFAAVGPAPRGGSDVTST